jgi:quercetin dioxygenase-like cupin family protein
MNKTSVMLAIAFSCGTLVGALGDQAVAAQKSTVSRIKLIIADLAECPGKEARLYTAELAPGAITPQHHHPGHYFSYVIRPNQ